MNEKWPYHDESTGYKIQENLFYGFGDSGSMYCANFKTREEAIAYIKEHHGLEDSEISTVPLDLGGVSVVVLSGREYVDELINRGLVDELGKWAE